ncbi:MAG: FG-GAP repeat protein [Omnitrophica WOR_2 bacterium]
MAGNKAAGRICKSLLIFLLLAGPGFSSGVAQQVPGEKMAPYIAPRNVASFDNFGAALAASGDTLIAGAPGTELKGAHNGGAAYIFQRHGKEWAEKAQLLPDLAQANSGFGFAVAISGNTAAVGARYESNPSGGNASGAVYVYTQQGSGWKLQARLSAADGAPFDLFGDAVAIDGDVLVVGARAADGPQMERNSGAVYVFQRSGETWNLFARLAPVDLEAESHFGQALALNGDTLAVGAPGAGSLDIPSSGRVYVYRLSGGSWTQESILAGEKPQEQALLGKGIALDGDTLAALAPQEYQEGEMPPSAAAYSSRFGIAYIFTRQGGSWSQQARLVPHTDEQYGSVIRGLALSGDSGGRRLVLSGMGMGRLARFQQKGQEWQELSELNADLSNLTFGEVISISGSQVLLGHRMFDQNNGPYSTGEALMSAGAVFTVEW